MLIGLIVYIAGSILCFIANTIDYLLLARLIQGFGAGAGSILTQTIARESLHQEKRHRFFSAFGFAIAFSITLGPFVGGYLIQWFNWRANFLLLVILGTSIIILTSMYLPETKCKYRTQKKKIGEVLRMFIFDKHIYGCIWLVAVTNGMLYSYYAEGPFIFIKLIHLSASKYGCLSSCIALAVMLGSISLRYTVAYIPANKLIAIGCVIMLISSILLVEISLSDLINYHYRTISIILIIFPIMGIIFGGSGFVVPMILSTALQKYQPVLGTAGALFGLSYYIVIAVLTWIMGLIHNQTLLPMPIYFLTLIVISVVVFYSLIRKN